MPALPPKLEKIAIALAGGDSHRLAYIAAGYKYNRAGAYRMCIRPEIKNRVVEIREERERQSARARQVAAQQSGVDIGWIEQHAKVLVLGALRGDPVRDRDGRIKKDPETQALIYKPDRTAAAKGLEILGRMKGAFIDRTEIGGPGDFSRMDDAELDLAILGTAKELGLPAQALKMLEDLTKKEREAAE